MKDGVIRGLAFVGVLILVNVLSQVFGWGFVVY